MGKKTVADAIESYGENARSLLETKFTSKGISYPPNKLALLSYKDTNLLEVWAANEGKKYLLITNYSIEAASGVLGPKLREGDKQVPEGLYKITSFNPNSSYHLSMKLNYPNKFDQYYANIEGRIEPGTNIFIHGKASSIGCLAMGDAAIEELFTLVFDTGRSNTKVLISPTNPSINKLVVPAGSPSWTEEFYQKIDVQYQAINPYKAN
ncbi:hypothetical protein C0W96_01175 [Photobacterium kishitanii]|uniref:L,D-transpeptidase family protein n=1 Tax=Photobacterium kishitanii TaxID=318456 RepID=UPI0009B9E5A7|nr:L,D-transpeptidase family protein [Photobacterium kishitanii]PSV07895.1 hypothetical protein C0W96_01175 [Photobacterium kishitanii]PSV71432.1 hypothetical protein C0W29_21170 [Photobacterium kishitanii]